MASPLVKRYLIALDKYKWIGIGLFVAVLGASGYVAIQPVPPPTYLIEGQMTYNTVAFTLSATGSQIREQGKGLSEEALLADNVLEEVANEVPGTKPKQVRRGAKISFPKGDEKAALIKVRFVDENPKRGTAVVDSLMKHMVVQSRLINTARLRSIIQTINERLPTVEKELRAAEQNLERYDRIEGAALLAARDGSLVGAITSSRNSQRQLQLQLDGINAQMRSLEERLGLTPDEAYFSSALSADPIIANLRAQIHQTETQLKLVSRDLRPDHPTMIQLSNDKEAYERLLAERARELISGGGVTAPLKESKQIRQDSSLDPARAALANQLVSLATQRDTLERQLETNNQVEEELRSEYARIPNKELERARLFQQIGFKKALYDKIQAALSDAQAAEAETVSSLTMTGPAQVVREIKEEKNVLLTVVGGGFVGFLIGGGAIFLLSMLDGTCQTLEELLGIMRQRDIPVLGTLPLLENLASGSSNIPVVTEPDSPYAEFYERLRSNLRRVGETPPRVIMLTSTIPDEGKTVSAYNLAVASACAGRRTLLVEADLRSPSQSKSLKVAPDPDSRDNPLRYYSQPNDCIRLVPEVENLYIVPSAGPLIQSAAILESSEMERFLEDARARFDLVVVDASDLSSCNDAFLLEPYTDGMVLVTRPGYTKQTMLVQTFEQFEADEMELLGAIVNGAKLKVEIPVEPDSDELDPLHEPIPIAGLEADNNGASENWASENGASENGASENGASEQADTSEISADRFDW